MAYWRLCDSETRPDGEFLLDEFGVEGDLHIFAEGILARHKLAPPQGTDGVDLLLHDFPACIVRSGKKTKSLTFQPEPKEMATRPAGSWSTRDHSSAMRMASCSGEMRLPERNCKRLVIMARAAEERPSSVQIYRVIVKPVNPRGHELLIMRVWYDGPSQAW